MTLPCVLAHDVVVYSLSYQRVHASLSPALHASLLPEGDHIPADADGDSSRPTQAFYMASNSQKSSINMALLYKYSRSLTFENLCQAEELNAVLQDKTALLHALARQDGVVARRWSPEVMMDAAARGGRERKQRHQEHAPFVARQGSRSRLACTHA